MLMYPFPVNSTRPLCESVTLEALGRVLPRELVETVLQDTGAITPRVKKLDLVLTVFLVVAMSLFTRESQWHVLQILLHALRALWPKEVTLPVRSASCYRRAQLGARPMAALFHRVCQPMATPQTHGAFLNDLRLMAIDGTVEDVRDTAANVRAFGRWHNDQGAVAYPQIRCVYLMEVGTHAVVDAGLWPIHVGEDRGAHRVTRSLTPGMLVLWDQGLHSYALIRRVRAQGAHVLGRVPPDVRVLAHTLLPDGSYLATLQPPNRGGVRGCPPLRVRLIEYVLPHPQDPHRDCRYRLVTTLLDWRTSPAACLAATYVERWEEEGMLDEMTVHQRLPHTPLRSKTPVGVVQEWYGLLLAHYAIRTVMHETALQEDVDPDRVSFVHALRTVRLYLPDLQRAHPLQRAQVYQRLLDDVAAGLLPPRQGRHNPRLVKRRINRYSLRSPARLAAFKANQPRYEAMLI